MQKDIFDEALISLIDIANKRPRTFSTEQAHLFARCIRVIRPEPNADLPTLVKDDPNPETTARTLLLNGVLQGHENGAYSIHQSAFVHELRVHWTQQQQQQQGKGRPKPAPEAEDAPDQ